MSHQSKLPTPGPLTSGILMVPSFVLEVLPTLKDSELRVLLIVLSSTLGWLQADGTRKRRDWISHGQFQRRTGRSGQAVSDAIDNLVKARFLSVSTENGFNLDSKESRRACKERLFYGLSPSLLDAVLSANPWLEPGNPRSTRTQDSGLYFPETTKQEEILNPNNKEAHLFAAPVVHEHTGWQRAGSIVEGRRVA